MRVALYARVSTQDKQDPETQLRPLREFAAARGWSAVEYIDRISGSKERRPGLDQLMADSRKRKIDVILVWRMDRVARSLRHLLNTITEWESLGVAFVSLMDNVDATTPSGKLMMHVIGALAEYERSMIIERVRAGVARAKAQGKRIGRTPHTIPDDRFQAVSALSVREAAKALGVGRSIVHRWRLSHNPSSGAGAFASKPAGIEPLSAQ